MEPAPEPKIIYEDENIVAIDKPSGMMTHPDGREAARAEKSAETASSEESKEGFSVTASDWFAAHYPASSTVGETQRLQDGSEILRPGVVHRLDRETSGVLIFAKTPDAHAFYKKAFQDREVHKTYLAFVYGVPKERKGTIDFSIGRSRKDFRLRSAQPKAKGTLREAITRYEVIGSISGGGENQGHALLKVMPETGRTHQIRVHLKAIHHPIVCDPLYAPNHPCDLGFSRLGLHAYELDIPLMPKGNDRLNVAEEQYERMERKLLIAPVPADLEQARALLQGH